MKNTIQQPSGNTELYSTKLPDIFAMRRVIKLELTKWLAISECVRIYRGDQVNQALLLAPPNKRHSVVDMKARLSGNTDRPVSS